MYSRQPAASLTPGRIPDGDVLLFVNYNSQLAQRDKELQFSQIKAHAARISHSRRSRSLKGGTSAPVSRKRKDRWNQDRSAEVLLRLSHCGGEDATYRAKKPPILEVGGSMREPFGVLGSLNMPDYVHEVIQFACLYTWRELANSDRLQNPVRSFMSSLVTNHPSIFHSVVMANILHLKVRQPNPDRTRLNLLSARHEAETISLVNKQLAADSNNISDAMLYSIILLAVNGISDDDNIYKSYPLSPLATNQLFHIYGRMAVNEVHVKGLYALAKKKGGLAMIATPGISDALEVGDLFLCTRMGNAPLFPWRHDYEWPSSSDRFDTDPEVQKLAGLLGTSFPRSVLRSIIKIVKMMCDATVGLDQYHRDTAGAPSLPTLTRARNGIQHQLLSLPIAYQLQTDGRIMIEMCRIALLIYSDMVLFPTPPHTGVRTRHASSMTLPLTLAKSHVWKQHRAFMTWIATLGGIAAYGTGLREFYVNLLRLHACPVSPSVFASSMLGFLWWEPVCGPPAIDLWAEAMHLISDDEVGRKA